MRSFYILSHRIWTNWKIDLGEKLGDMFSRVPPCGTVAEFMSWNRRQFFILYQLFSVRS